MEAADGRKLLVDFLSTLIGLIQDEVRRMAVPVEVEGEPPVWVMHPILCLQSRLENLYRLPAKRNGNGVAQARVAVDVAREFLIGLHADEDQRSAGRAAKRICRIAASPAGVFAFFEYQIDPLAAVDPGRFPDPRFQEREWPKLRKSPDGKRAIEARRRATLT